MISHDEPLSAGELDDLARALAHITTDLIDRLAIAATDPWACTGIHGPHVASQPRSRPPYDLGAEIILSTLREALAQTITAISDHRKQPTPNLATLVQAATWLRKHHIALAGMVDGRHLADGLHRAIQEARRSLSSSSSDSSIDWTSDPTAIATANRSIVTAPQAAQIARDLGLAADGLTEHRVTHLRRRHGLRGTQDPDTRTWFYRLGDVIEAHHRAQAGRTA